MEEMKRIKIPAFGNWECYYDNVPITDQYFDSAIQPAFFRSSLCFPNQEVDLFKVPVSPLKTQYVYNQYIQTRVVKRGGERRKVNGEVRRQGKVYDSTAHENATTGEYKASKAVDEDLYKIPPELLYRKPKKKVLRGFWFGCLGNKCVACA